MANIKHHSASDMNMELLTTFLEWEKRSRFIDVASKNNLSRPYVCSVSENYFNAKNRIMIIGQEAYGFPLFDSDFSEQRMQKWGVEYLEKQLWDIGKQRYNKSAFWQLFRCVEKNFGYCPCWNNVDKAHRIIEQKTVPLTTETEKSLNAALLSTGQTILQEEITITKPSAVLFITGPYYYESMAAALKVDENELRLLKPTIECLCTDISEISRIGLPVLWTYHPTFLNRNETKQRLFSRTINSIQDWLPAK